MLVKMGTHWYANITFILNTFNKYSNITEIILAIKLGSISSQYCINTDKMQIPQCSMVFHANVVQEIANINNSSSILICYKIKMFQATV